MGLVHDAWEAVAAGDRALAEKLARRALDAGRVNPRVWLEHGRVLWWCGLAQEAVQSVRRAVEIAPCYEEARAELVRMRGDDRSDGDASCADDPGEAAEPAPVRWVRTEGCDWEQIFGELSTRGFSVLPALLAPVECGEARGWRDEVFEHVSSTGRGGCEIRILGRPFPALIEDLRVELYARAATLANRLEAVLGRDRHHPAALATFLGRCTREGQRRSAVALLRIDSGGAFDSECEDRAPLVFPLRVLVDVGEPGAGTVEFSLRDLRPGKKRHRRGARLAPGDAVLFCSRERLDRVGGVHGLQAVWFGIEPAAHERWVLDLPFHDV